MAWWLRISILIVGFSLSALCNVCHQTVGFCSQVYQMQQACTGSNPSISEGVARVGKSGARGSKGDRGFPGIVNYTEIDEKISSKFREMDSRIDAKLARYEQLIGEVEENTVKTAILKKRIESTCGGRTRNDAITWDEKGGIVYIYRNAKRYEVYCDQTTDEGGWIVFQRRIDGSVDFHRNWNDYVSGFGNNSNEFWMGLEVIHELTGDGDYELRIELTDWAGKSVYAKYGSFALGDASTKYRLSLGAYTGTAGDSFIYHREKKFSTKDQDNDILSSYNCAAGNGGGWWFHKCDNSNLNGIYRVGGLYSGTENGVEWETWNHNGHYSMKYAEMKFRLKR